MQAVGYIIGYIFIILLRTGEQYFTFKLSKQV